MKAKVVDQKLDNYGQVVDVVLNKYLGKYTDGNKTYPKASISFDSVEEDNVCQEDKELKEYAFRILCAKENATVKKSNKEEISAEIDYAFGVAKLFQFAANGVIENEKESRKVEKSVQAQAATSGNATLPSESVTPKETETENEKPSDELKNEPEIGLNDLISELNNE